MIIRNKFNGYSRDGTRVYPDPLTIAGVVGTGTGMLGTGIATAGAIGEGVALGTTLATGAELGGLASIFSNPQLALGGLEAAAPVVETVAPQAAAQAAAFNQATNTAVQNALQQQAAQQATQNALGSQAFQPLNPATVAPNVASNAAANPSVSNIIQEGMKNVYANPTVTPDVATNLAANPVVSPAVSPAANPVIDADYMARMREIYGPTTSTDVWGKTTTQLNTGSYAGIPSGSPVVPGQTWSKNLMNLISNPSMQGAKDYVSEHPYATGIGAYALYNMLKGQPEQPKPSPGLIRPYTFESKQNKEAYLPSSSTAERNYFTNKFVAGTPYEAPGPEYRKADGGIVALGVGGPVETMSAENAVGDNSMYPQAGLQTAMYSNPLVQRPMPTNVVKSGIDMPVDPYTGEQRLAGGGIANLGGYSDGGQLLRGPGDGVSDSIPASIGDRQPARLADGEFVVPARIVSELGNGSTEAGARKLYAMMNRVQKARGKTTGKDKVATNTNADKYLPA